MRTLFVAVTMSLISGCSCGSVTPEGSDGGARSDEVRLTTIPFCTTVTPVDEPTKVLVLVDVSGTMCVSDPSSSGTGFCQGLSSASAPRRLEVLNALIDRVNASPNGRLAVVSFGAAASYVYPPQAGGGDRFARPPGALKNLLATTLTTLSGPSDLEAALTMAAQIISADVTQERSTDPARLARTSYRVVVIIDGPPAPRCAANDALDGGATPDQPDGIWADTSPACNDAAGFNGMDHNQTLALLTRVDQLKSFSAGARSLRIDTTFVFNDTAMMTCGAICQDLHGTYAGVAASAQYDAAKRDARYVLERIATRGGGTLRDFDTTSMNDPLADVTFSTTRSTTLQQVIALPMRSVPGPKTPLADSDGDGLADSAEADAGTQVLVADSDGDCFSDGFEARRAAMGFDALSRDDVRGCSAAAMPPCACTDTDGDGLTQYEEQVLGTFASLPDSDFDGVLDGVEARSGMDPLAREPTRDGDGDNVLDVDEVVATADPASPGDSAYREKYSVTPRLTQESQQGSQVCWNIAIDGLSVVTLKTAGGEASGHNLVKVLLAEGFAKDEVTSWKGDCIWLKREAGAAVPTVQFRSNNWRALGQVTDSSCDGTAP